MANQLPGEKQTPPRRGMRGGVNFIAYSKEPPHTHKATNMGETPFHSVSFLFNEPRPGGFPPSTRASGSGIPRSWTMLACAVGALVSDPV